MFSILVCSRKDSFLENLKVNLSETVGYPYELLVWNNLTDPKPITEVYNLLAGRAQYPYWCFIHEDIRFDTKNWGANLLQAFSQNPETGLIGIAGSKYKSKTPSGWSTGIEAFDRCNIYHQDKNDRIHHIYMNPLRSVLEPVVNVDGVFIAIRREVWLHARFNDELLRGFHLYDIDFSLRVTEKWKAAVIFNIDIMHFTQGGNFGDEWMKYTLAWHHTNAGLLPQHLDDFIPAPETEKKIGIFWLKRLSAENISFQNKRMWIRAGRSWSDPGSWLYILLFLTGRFWKRKTH